ncbi:hypothetical protein PVK06_001421 [Gossypium arboreum]|uniref:Uncharacterized protein n=1 Tax=Gossypium arboreum TaxID=29729 RepID=A0ABR0R212_GOSAR|nr:hypothetical protein PVK06_001421 [Gossypium arboreum]
MNSLEETDDRQLGTSEYLAKTPCDLYDYMFEQESLSTPLEEVLHNVSTFDLRDQCSTENYPKLNLESPQGFGIRDENELKIDTEVFDPINIDIQVEVVIDVEVERTTNLELKPILNEIVDELIHFMAITEEVSIEEIDEFIMFSFEEGKAQETKASRDMEWRKDTPEDKLRLVRILHQVARDVDVALVEDKAISLESIEDFGSNLALI